MGASDSFRRRTLILSGELVWHDRETSASYAAITPAPCRGRSSGGLEERWRMSLEKEAHLEESFPSLNQCRLTFSYSESPTFRWHAQSLNYAVAVSPTKTPVGVVIDQASTKSMKIAL